MQSEILLLYHPPLFPLGQFPCQNKATPTSNKTQIPSLYHSNRFQKKYNHHHHPFFPFKSPLPIVFLSFILDLNTPHLMDPLHSLIPPHHPNAPSLHHLLLLLLLSTLPLAQSEIKNIKIVADSRNLILFEQFGYSHGGHAVVAIKGVSWKPPPRRPKSDVNPTLMGFFLIRKTLFSGIMNESLYSDRFCPLTSHFIVPILAFKDLDAASSCTRSVDVVIQDEYSLLFCNCQPDVAVTMDVRTEMYNMEGGDKEYLPAGKTQLPKIYFTFFLLYLVFFMAWVFACVKQRATVDKIHTVMGALLLFKALKLVCAAEDTWYVKRTGTPHGWDVAFYVFGFFKGVLLFTVIVLIGTGWSFLKPYLQVCHRNYPWHFNVYIW